MLRLYRIARYILKHEERLLNELLLAKDPVGYSASCSPVLWRLKELFALIVRTRP